MFAYNRDMDDALVLAAGIPTAWLQGEGIAVQGLRTPQGQLNYRLQRSDKQLVLEVQPAWYRRSEAWCCRGRMPVIRARRPSTAKRPSGSTGTARAPAAGAGRDRCAERVCAAPNARGSNDEAAGEARDLRAPWGWPLHWHCRAVLASSRHTLRRMTLPALPGMSMVTFNLHHDREDWPSRRRTILAELKRLQPDAVALQEVIQRRNVRNQAQWLG
jgi:hypothetical protein